MLRCGVNTLVSGFQGCTALLCFFLYNFATNFSAESLFLKDAQTWAECGGWVGAGGRGEAIAGAGGFHLSDVLRWASSEIFLTG